MDYQIKEFAKLTGLSAHTLRYYEKEGLLPFVARNDSGIRHFREGDLEWVQLINCLKITGMPIKEIRQFIDWCQEGDSTLQERLAMFLERREAVLEQMRELERSLEHIDYKIWYYQTAVEAGTEQIHKKNVKNA